MADKVIENLITKLSFDYDKSKLDKFDINLKSAVKGLTAIVAGATAAAGAVFAFTKKISESNDKLGKFALRTGIDVRALQELGYVAELNGGSIDSMNGSLESLSMIASEAARGVGAGVEAFGILGVSVTDAGGKVRSADDLLNSISDSISRLGSQAEKIELAQKLGINSDLLLSIQNGSEAILRQRKEARELGFIISPDDAKASANFNDELLRIKKILSGGIIGASISREITPLMKSFIEWYKVNRNLIKQKIDVFIEKGSYALRVLFNTIKRVAAAINTIVNAIGGWKVALVSATAAFVALNASALLMPILVTAASAAILLLLEDIITYAQGGDSAIGNLADRFPAFKAVLDGVLYVIKMIIDGWALLFTEGDMVIRELIVMAKEFGAAIKKFIMQPIEKVREIISEMLSFDDAKRFTVHKYSTIGMAKGLLGKMFDRSRAANESVSGQGGQPISSVINNTTNSNPDIRIEINGGDTDKIRMVIKDVLDEQYSGAQTNFETQVDY